MYSSDEYYTCAKGVDDGCFDNSKNCFHREEYSSAGNTIPGVYNYPDSS